MKKVFALLVLQFVMVSLMFFCQTDLFLIHGFQNVLAENTVSASDLINLVNGIRTANGLGALSVDYSLMACAQATADTMAANGMMGHIGNVSGRASSYGYNNGNTCFATENFATGPSTISQIAAIWSDATHLIAMTDSSYCAIGAGVSAEVNGRVYYVVQAAYPANKTGCGYSASSGSSKSSSSGGNAATVDISQIISSVKTAEPDSDGKIYHTVEEGQTLWAIASAYDTTVDAIASWNGITDITALYLGEKLLIPIGNMKDQTATPDVAATILPTADAQGVFRHEVKSGETLWAIANLWHVTVESILHLNGLTEDSALQLGWKLKIPVTPTMTLEPTMTPFPTDALSTATETIMPSATLNLVETAITATETSRTKMPKPSTRTFVILGIFGLALIGVIIILIDVVIRKHT